MIHTMRQVRNLLYPPQFRGLKSPHYSTAALTAAS